MRRTATPRHYLMVRPTYFDVEYSINPWMDPKKPTDTGLAVAQWEWLRDLYLELGHRVELLEPRPGLLDMVFAANGATVLNGQVFVARFRHPQRRPEADAYLDWFRDHGYRDVRQSRWVNEGEGDYLVAAGRLLAGTGFRTDSRAHRESEEFFGVPVTGLTLIDPHYYHLDTALCVLDAETVMYYPGRSPRTAAGCWRSCTRTPSRRATSTPPCSVSTRCPTAGTWCCRRPRPD